MERAGSPGIVKGDFLLRMAGVSFIVGAVLLIVFNILLPRPSDLADVKGVLQMVADRGSLWELAHLLLAAGIWALMIGVAGIYRSITTGSAAVWARLGFYGVVVGTTLWSATFALSGRGLAGVAGAWAGASGADKAALFQAATALYHLNAVGLMSMTIIVYWLALAFVGMGIALGTVYPRWLGWVLVVLGVATVIVGVARLVGEPSQAIELTFGALALLSSVWALVTGIWIARKAF